MDETDIISLATSLNQLDRLDTAKKNAEGISTSELVKQLMLPIDKRADSIQFTAYLVEARRRKEALQNPPKYKKLDK